MGISVGLEIRKAQIGEMSQVQNIAKISWSATYKGIIPLEVQEKFLKSAYSDDMKKRRLEQSFFLK